MVAFKRKTAQAAQAADHLTLETLMGQGIDFFTLLPGFLQHCTKAAVIASWWPEGGKWWPCGNFYQLVDYPEQQLAIYKAFAEMWSTHGIDPAEAKRLTGVSLKEKLKVLGLRPMPKRARDAVGVKRLLAAMAWVAE